MENKRFIGVVPSVIVVDVDVCTNFFFVDQLSVGTQNILNGHAFCKIHTYKTKHICVHMGLLYILGRILPHFCMHLRQEKTKWSRFNVGQHASSLSLQHFVFVFAAWLPFIYTNVLLHFSCAPKMPSTHRE